MTQSPESLYRRWLPFGFLTSHSRVHGAPPTEPWYYGKEFTDYFRRCAELKYKLMPYVYAQSKSAPRTAGRCSAPYCWSIPTTRVHGW